MPEEIDVADVAATTKPELKSIKKAEPVVEKNKATKKIKEYRPSLATLIAANDLEYKANLYWSNKGEIDMDLDQTWRDLPKGLQQRMELHFDSFTKTIDK